MNGDMSHADFERLAGAVADSCVAKMQPLLQEQMKSFAEMKVYLLTGVDCKDKDAMTELRKTVEFGQESREWFHSDEGRASIDAMKRLAGMIGTPDGAASLAALEKLGKTLTTDVGADRFGALSRLGETLSDTERWARSRLAKAAVIGLIALAVAGLAGVNPIKEALKFVGNGH